MISFLTNLSNYFFMRSQIKKFGKPVRNSRCNLAVQIDCLQYLTPDVSEQKITLLYNSLIQSGFWIIEKANLNTLKAFLTKVRNKEIISNTNQLSDAEYWYIDLNLISQLSLEELKEKASDLLSIFEGKKIILIINSIHLYFDATNKFNMPFISYTDRLVSTLVKKKNVYVIGIRNR